ncbi:MAG: tryptophan synthase subunit alpha [Alphaproteobacteria bacterium]
MSASQAVPLAAAQEGRIARRFARLKAKGCGGFVPFITAGDPDGDTSLALLKGLAGAGADLIELGMPFSDPMADGPIIQASSQRALKAGARMRRTLAMVEAFRADDGETPLILMGYYNPIFSYGVGAFLADARAAGVDGLIVVDLPPEEDEELRPAAREAGLDFVRLATPTTDDKRIARVLDGASGFIYYVSITGITGTRSAAIAAVTEAVGRLRRHTDLPIAVGFGIKTPEQAAAVASAADAAVVGSALVEKIRDGLDEAGAARAGLVEAVLGFASSLAKGVHEARRDARAP